MAFIELKNIKKEYTGEVNVTAVDNVSFKIEQGEFVVILGPSGAGKTTILNMIGGMDKPTSGERNYLNTEDIILDLYFNSII